MIDLRLGDVINKITLPLQKPNDLTPLIQRIGNAKYVLLGEASHGTSEFYTVRAELSKRLIKEKACRFIAVEGDWPSCNIVNRYIKSYPNAPSTAREAVQDFNRWPTWMWANEEMISLIEWLKEYNDERPVHEQVGFFGLDLYSLWESMEEIITYLDKIGSPDVDKAKKAFSCFEPFNRREQEYAVNASFFSEDCIDEVIDLLMTIQNKKKGYTNDPEESLSLEINALVTADAEQFYRAMVRDGPDSWNIRDKHMVEVAEKIMALYGHDSKGIFWAHNTHVGDARATTMVDDGEINFGQLLRERHSDVVFIIGFGTYEGTVIAGNEWGAPLQKMDVPPARMDSWEYLLHHASPTDKIIIMDHDSTFFNQAKGNRAIGVVYQPQYEHYGNYVPTNLAMRYDAFIFIDRTTSLTPIEIERVVV